jgi:WD40 repeat protein
MYKNKVVSYICLWLLFFSGDTLCAASASRLLFSRAIAPVKSFASSHPRLTKTAGVGAAVLGAYVLYQWWWNRKYRDTFYCGHYVHALAVLPNGHLVTANRKAPGISEPWREEGVTIKIWDVQRRKCLQSFDVICPDRTGSVQSITPLSDKRIAIRFFKALSIYILDLQTGHFELVIPYPPAPQEEDHLVLEGGNAQNYLVARNWSDGAYRWDVQSNEWNKALDLDGEAIQRITFGRTTAWTRWSFIEIKNGSTRLRAIKTKASGMLLAGLPDGRLASVQYGGSFARRKSPRRFSTQKLYHQDEGTGLVQIWNIDTGICEQEIPCGFSVTSMIGLPDGNVAVAGSSFRDGAKILRVAPRPNGIRSTPPDSLHPMNLI